MFERTRRVHFVGIGGVGMSGIAEILLTLGYEVSGSDISEGARVRNLRRRGADIELDHAPSNVDGADVVVQTSAVDGTNPEIREAKARDIPVIPRAEMLAELMRLKEGIAVAGTHGKTTTTALISRVLQAGELDPTVVVGGRLHSIGIGARLGTDDLIVVEADESDGSFLHLNPVMSVVTNIENEHLDNFSDMNELKDVFLDFINSVPFYGFSALCGDNEQLAQLLKDVRKPFETYGLSQHNSLRAVDLSIKSDRTRFTVKHDDRYLGEINLPIPGKHNVKNALAACSIAFKQGVPFDRVKKGLESFEGVARRFELKGEVDSVKVFDDYAHHPTEIEKTLAAARKIHDGEIIVIFQPHRYSRTKLLAGEFGPSFEEADKLIVTDVYPAGEEPIEGVDIDFLEKHISPHRNGHLTVFENSRENVIDWTVEQIDPDRDQLIFTMGAGDVVNLAEPIIDRARKQLKGKKV